MSRQLPIRRVLVLLAVLSALAAGGTVAATARTSGEPQLTTGPGTWLAGHTDFVGAYRAHVGARWVTVYCIDPDRPAPRRIALHTRARLPALGRAATRLLAETLAAHGSAATATQAEAVSQALNEEAGNGVAVARRARYLPPRVLALAARYVAEARRLHGPYVLHMRLPTSPLPGQAAVGTVTLHAGAHGAAGTVALRHSPNVATPRLVRTDASGRGTFSYRTTGSGPVQLSALARVTPTTVRASVADGSTQMMVSWSPRRKVEARAGYEGRGPRFRHRYACTDVCDGQPLVTLTACAPAGHYAARITYYYATQTHQVDFAAAEHRVCASWRTAIADGSSVRAAWQFRTPAGWTPPIAAAGAFTVDCPAAPPVAVWLDYDCADARFTAALGHWHDGALVPWQNTTRHRTLLVLGGAVSGRYELAPGASATPHSFGLTCGAHATVTVTGGVQRADGSVNYGHTATVVTP
jgi:hypothetical protein